ncbi:hypothetical protein [Candidatus Albibeggiatoa sp. nov. BB20]|uniref:hypothetical protein n=1 Tax=Candidatus Albibeggiatoa sp. nov. BB20 TaxID=3162723 RepID=UPI0033658978
MTEVIKQQALFEQQAQQMLTKYAYCFVPVVTKQRLGLDAGLGINRVDTMLRTGVLPSYSLGTVKLVNLAAMFVQKNMLPSVLLPNPIPKERFADLVGTSTSAVQGWINNGYLPTVKKGKYRLIDLLTLFSNCVSLNKSVTYDLKRLQN